MAHNNDLLNAPRIFPGLNVQGNVLLAMHELQELAPEEVIQAVIHLAYNCYILGAQDQAKQTEREVKAQIERDKVEVTQQVQPAPGPSSALPPYVMEYTSDVQVTR